VCVIKLRTVTLCRHSDCGPFVHSGKYRSIGASRFSGEGKSPSTSFSTSVVVTTTFVSDAMSYIVSAFTAGDFASYFKLPMRARSTCPDNQPPASRQETPGRQWLSEPPQTPASAALLRAHPSAAASSDSPAPASRSPPSGQRPVSSPASAANGNLPKQRPRQRNLGHVANPKRGKPCFRLRKPLDQIRTSRARQNHPAFPFCKSAGSTGTGPQAHPHRPCDR